MKPIVTGVQVHNDDDTVLVVYPSDLFALASEPVSKCDTCTEAVLSEAYNFGNKPRRCFNHTQKPTHLTEGLWNHKLSRVHSRCREVAAEATCAAACFLIFRVQVLLDCALTVARIGPVSTTTLKLYSSTY
eukprot:16383-Heterococcus_DN1.PRE.3